MIYNVINVYIVSIVSVSGNENVDTYFCVENHVNMCYNKFPKGGSDHERKELRR